MILQTESILLNENVYELKTPATDRKELSFAAGVAAYGMVLRNSEYKGTADFDMAYELVGRGLDNDPHGTYSYTCLDRVWKFLKKTLQFLS